MDLRIREDDNKGFEMNLYMQLTVITPEKIIYEGDIKEIVVNTAAGELGILPHHINLFTRVIPGELVIKEQKKEHYLGLTGGFLEVKNNVVTILADYAVRAEDIEVKKAMEAQKRAEDLLKKRKEGISEQEYATAQAELARAIMELHVANKRRRNVQ
jgi:F-type H+-transporting ATPase subunit epsilon